MRKKLLIEWLEEGSKKGNIGRSLRTLENETHGNAVFVVSATEKRNLEKLRQTILNKVREMYRIRYPYKTEFLY